MIQNDAAALPTHGICRTQQKSLPWEERKVSSFAGAQSNFTDLPLEIEWQIRDLAAMLRVYALHIMNLSIYTHSTFILLAFINQIILSYYCSVSKFCFLC